ncbi:MAG TPA: hypothetical protein VFI31_26825 [Pirellulales bacterium]|nr:hypothetical protein [Pirellulales bacterium]
MKFIGLTWKPEEVARRFLETHQIPWPNGVGTPSMVDALQGAAPTLYVVSPGGRIVWNDGRARYEHATEDLGTRLEKAIQQALDESEQP